MTQKSLEAGFEPLLSVAEVREMLGVSEPTVYRLIVRGDLAYLKIGGRTLFQPNEVRAFLRQSARRRTP